MIVINPSPKIGTRNYDERVWDGWPKLLRILADCCGGFIVVTGTDEQVMYTHTIVKESERVLKWIVNACGMTSLGGLAHLLGDADILITVNTFTMHLASALNVPCVAIVDKPSAEVVKHKNIKQVIMPCTVDEVMEAINGLMGEWVAE